jgi:hypothetical protein
MHPKCPCSSATLTELNRIVARARGELTVTVAFYSPSSEPEGWGRTSLRDEAAAIPGVRVVDDPDGREAALFGAVNSGHVVLYAPNSRLLFHGGITASRAHEGDNLGEDSVVAAINGAAPTATTTPTYGCELTSGCDIPVCPQCDERSGS